MELQTVIQVSKTFGISAQMLRYYERNGLIQSSRKDDYAYRVYDEDAIKRLQQIVILRKLQIPVKQIRYSKQSRRGNGHRSFRAEYG